VGQGRYITTTNTLMPPLMLTIHLHNSIRGIKVGVLNSSAGRWWIQILVRSNHRL